MSRFTCVFVAGVHWASWGGKGWVKEDDDGKDDEEEGSSDTAASTPGPAEDVVTRQETQRRDATAAAVETGRTGQGAGRRDRTHSTVHLTLAKMTVK